MNNLWNQTFELFRRNPALWVPCSAATLFVFTIKKLETAGVLWLTHALSTHSAHSVFGGYTESTNAEQAVAMSIKIALPVGILRDFAEICLFVIALVATKNLVQMLLNEQVPQLATAGKQIRPRFREILIFTFKYMVIMGISTGILLILTTSPIAPERMRQWAQSQTNLLIFGLAIVACLAWLLMPSAIRLLRPKGSPRISLEDRRRGTLFAVAASAASLGIQILLKRAEATLVLETTWEANAVAIANTLVVNLPQVVLFVSLALLAIQQPDELQSLSAEQPVLPA